MAAGRPGMGMNSKVFAGSVVLALLLAAPAASAMTVYGPNAAFTISGTATDCLTALTPLGPGLWLVLFNFNGSILPYAPSLSASWVAFQLTTNNVTCLGPQGNITVGGSGVGLIVTNP